MICIYHSKDLDGYSSGAIIKKWYKQVHPDKGEIKLIGYDYGQPIPELPKGEPIIMVDVSMPMPIMQKLAINSNWQFTWIDHHISVIKEFQNYQKEDEPPFLEPYIKVGPAACELAWEYCFPNVEIPKAITLLGKYDTWRKENKGEWDNEILPFQYGMRLYPGSAEEFPQWLLDNEESTLLSIVEIIEEGNLLISYQRLQDKDNAKRNCFEIEFEGLRALCLNTSNFSSQVFESVYNEEKHDIMIPFQYNGSDKFWKFSLYTTKPEINCSVIAKKYGGGGHQGAAGFQTSFPSFMFV